MKYRFVMPSEDKANALGIRFEGLETRTRLWLTGVGFANHCLTGNPLQIQFHRDGFTLISNDEKLTAAITTHLNNYGYYSYPSSDDSHCHPRRIQ